jgi:hypothetical protein
MKPESLLTIVLLTLGVFCFLVHFIEENKYENNIKKCTDSCKKIEYKFQDECEPTNNSDCEFKCRINIVK